MKVIETYKIPEVLTLFGTKWKVITKKEVKSSNNQSCWGLVDLENKTISLTSRIGENTFKTLIHECSHILDYLTNMGQEKQESETFAKISSLFYFQLFKQIELISSKPICKKK